MLPCEEWITYSAKKAPKTKSTKDVEDKKQSKVDDAKLGMRIFFLIKANLPRPLETQVSRILEAKVPAIRRASSSLKGKNCSLIFYPNFHSQLAYSASSLGTISVRKWEG